MEITRSRDKCFDDVANYLITMISLTLTIEMYRTERDRAECDHRYAPNHQAMIDAKQVGKRLVFYPHTLLDEICAGRWPTRVVMEEKPIQIPAPQTLPLGPVERPLFAFAQSMLINYFERECPQIEAKHGKDTTRWPAHWNFGRLVRNSVAHNNEVFFTNPHAAPVTWHGLTYSPADNGRKVVHVDIWPADLIYLMLDMDAHLR